MGIGLSDYSLLQHPLKVSGTTFTLAARGLEEHDIFMRVSLIFVIIVSFMLFIVLLLLLYFFRRISDS